MSVFNLEMLGFAKQLRLRRCQIVPSQNQNQHSEFQISITNPKAPAAADSERHSFYRIDIHSFRRPSAIFKCSQCRARSFSLSSALINRCATAHRCSGAILLRSKPPRRNRASTFSASSRRSCSSLSRRVPTLNRGDDRRNSSASSGVWNRSQWACRFVCRAT